MNPGVVYADQPPVRVPRVGGDEPRGGHGARDRNIRMQFDHLLYADVPSAEAIGMLCARYGLSERSLRLILKG